MKNIGKRIRIVRLSKNITLKELENLSGVLFARISKFERGIENPGEIILKNLEKALDVLFEDKEDIINEIDTLFNKFCESLFYQDLDIDYFKKSINKMQDKYLTSHNYVRILLINFILDVLEESKEKERFTLKELLDENTIEEQLYYEYKGIMEYKEQNYAEAIKYLKYSLTLNNNERSIAMVYYHFGMVYEKINDVEAAEVFSIKAQEIFIKFGSYRQAVSSNLLLANIYIQKKNYKHALILFESCIDSIKYVNCSNEIKALILRNKAWLLILDKKYDASLSVLGEANQLNSKDSHNIMYQIWCNFCLYKFNKAQSIINENYWLSTDAEYSSRFKLYTELVNLGERKPTKNIINLSKKIYYKLCNENRYDLIGFYLDIVIELYSRTEDLYNLVVFQKEKIALLESIQR